MPPKVKKKKKTKEELEEERRQAEEAARAAEEGAPVTCRISLACHGIAGMSAMIRFKSCTLCSERLRLEEFEFQRLEELERQRVELLATYTEQENERSRAGAPGWAEAAGAQCGIGGTQAGLGMGAVLGVHLCAPSQ
ncbi:hypothetical protein HaLaN_19339, partial [Haematococcus lacustris]